MAHSKQSYGVMSAPPSLSPTNTQSTLASNLSATPSSPPGPSTPPRASRSRTRYPDLGRVPLHRRGTSKTYERLEDLLKEAGYKETRVFTPEGERGESASDDHKLEDNRLSGMGAVVGFLANLLPNATTSRPTSVIQTHGNREHSPPPSPLDHRNLLQTPSNLTSSIGSLEDPTPRPTRQASVARSGTPHQRPSQHPPSQQQHHPPPHQTHIVHPRPSRAGAYLRHMASTTSMPNRPSSTPARSMRKDDDDPSVLFTCRGSGEGEDEHGQPPLPSTWLEAVARAVLFGGSGAHIGGPTTSQSPDAHHHHHQQQRKPQVQVLRPTRSSLSQVSSSTKHSNRRSGLTDHTNLKMLAPPPLLTTLERGRAGRSEGEVTRTRVVCRSAPGSRAGSLVRGEKGGGGGAGVGRGKERGRDNKRRRDDKDRLPSLARTKTEGDSWTKGRVGSRFETANDIKTRYLSGWGMDVNSEGEGGSDGTSVNSEEEEDDDEGELDLARMLVHPKRQNSIKSLRKHLASEGTGGSVAALTRAGRGISARGEQRGTAGMQRMGGGSGGGLLTRKPAVEEDDWDGQGQDDWGRGWMRRGGRNTDEDDDEAQSFSQFFGGADGRGSGRGGTGKSRLGLPSWGVRGGS